MKLEDCIFDQYIITEKGTVTGGRDPKIITKSLNCHVDTIQVRIRALSVSAVKAQLFYADKTDFSEENSVSVTITENEYAKNIPVDSYTSDLRIDIGDSEDVSYVIDKIIINPDKYDYLYGLVRNMSLKRILIYILGWLLIMAMLRDNKMTIRFMFDHRWAIGVALICFATVLKLHGSSIGCITESLTGADSSRLMGTARGIRSDEYAIFTQMAMSQSASGFKWFSDIWGYSPRDMYIIYGQPVRSIIMVYRPFALVYMIGGVEYGLAFFWSARTVLLFLVSFEFARLVTKDRRSLSVMYAFLVCFAPVVQWWFP